MVKKMITPEKKPVHMTKKQINVILKALDQYEKKISQTPDLMVAYFLINELTDELYEWDNTPQNYIKEIKKYVKTKHTRQ